MAFWFLAIRSFKKTQFYVFNYFFNELGLQGLALRSAEEGDEEQEERPQVRPRGCGKVRFHLLIPFSSCLGFFFFFFLFFLTLFPRVLGLNIDLSQCLLFFRRANTAELMKKMPEMLLDYKVGTPTFSPSSFHNQLFMYLSVSYHIVRYFYNLFVSNLI